MRQHKSWTVWASSCQNGLRWRVGCAPSQENQNITSRVPREHEAASCVERHHRATSILHHLSPTRRPMLKSQNGPVAGIPFSTTPSSCLTRLEPALFRVLLQHRLSLPLLLTKRIPVWPSTRRLWSRSGMLERRQQPLLAQQLLAQTAFGPDRFWPAPLLAQESLFVVFFCLFCFVFHVFSNFLFFLSSFCFFGLNCFTMSLNISNSKKTIF